jgi:hypothetical protein
MLVHPYFKINLKLVPVKDFLGYSLHPKIKMCQKLEDFSITNYLHPPIFNLEAVLGRLDSNNQTKV